MPEMKNIREAMQILERYEPNGYCHAEHDVIYLPGPKDLGTDDKKRLEELSIHWFDEVESWGAFT